MNTYILRAVKYFLSLLILLGVIFAFMFLSGASSPEDFIEAFISQKGALLLTALIFLSATYPFFGYTKREIKHPLDEEKLLKVMDSCGYTLKHRIDDSLVFNAQNVIKKIKSLGEDKIVITPSDNGFTMSGLRKEVVRIEYRVITFLKE